DIGAADQLGNIEPIEAPALIEMNEIVEPAWFIPVVLLLAAGLDLGCPVDQLVSVAVDIVDNRVDDDLAGADRADPHIGAAGQDRRPARDAAPGVDAGKDELFSGIELGAHRRIDASQPTAMSARTDGQSPPVLVSRNCKVTPASSCSRPTQRRSVTMRS